MVYLIGHPIGNCTMAWALCLNSQQTHEIEHDYPKRTVASYKLTGSSGLRRVADDDGLLRGLHPNNQPRLSLRSLSC